MKRALFTVVIAAISVSCFSGGVTGTATVNGTYTLQSVNGSALPYVVPGNAARLEIMDGVVNLYEGFTYAVSGQTRSMVGGQMTVQPTTENGTFSLQGNAIYFRNVISSVPLLPGTIDANKMTVLRGDLVYVYNKK
ncbi:MAG: hypothetical protein H0U64_12140 [Gemmatimonadaceae bacterium]|nr:hypothetical protein [Gemmatimonadaceae bacterium]